MLLKCLTDATAQDATATAEALDALTGFAVLTGEIARLHHIAASFPERLGRVADATRDAARRNAAVSAWQVTMTAETWRILDNAGIEARVFKGAALAAWLHGNAHVRNSFDIDILVPSNKVIDAQDVLLAAGWSLPFRLRQEHFGGEALKHYREVPFSNFGGTFHLDLHWRLLNPWNDSVLDEAVLFAPLDDLAYRVIVGGQSLPWFKHHILWQMALAHVVSSDWLGPRAWVDLTLVNCNA